MSGSSESVEQGLLGKAVHLDQPVDRRSGAAERKRSTRFARHRHDAPINARSRPSVEAHFSVTEGLPAFDGREIEVVEPDGSLQLVRAIAGEELTNPACDPFRVQVVLCAQNILGAVMHVFVRNADAVEADVADGEMLAAFHDRRAVTAGQRPFFYGNDIRIWLAILSH